MSKQQAILETLLGAAELQHNSALISRIRLGLEQLEMKRQSAGYRRLNAAASESNRPSAKAA
jgi:hypothetical protein